MQNESRSCFDDIERGGTRNYLDMFIYEKIDETEAEENANDQMGPEFITRQVDGEEDD